MKFHRWSLSVSLLLILVIGWPQIGPGGENAAETATQEKSPSPARIQQLESLVKLIEMAIEFEKQDQPKETDKTLALIAKSVSLISNTGSDRVVVNAGFEAGETGKTTPDGWNTGNDVPGVTYLWDQQNGKSGKASVCIIKTANTFFPIAEWYQTVNYEPGSTALKIRCQIKAENAAKAIVDVLFFDANSKPIKHEWASYIGDKKPNGKPISHGWKEYVGDVKIPPKTQMIQIGLQMYGPGKVWFDDINVEYVK